MHFHRCSGWFLLSFSLPGSDTAIRSYFSFQVVASPSYFDSGSNDSLVAEEEAFLTIQPLLCQVTFPGPPPV